jgi:Arc/MetJ-type ribon-helix-helix transcriptional regulator
MTVTLTTRTEQRLRHWVQSGLYATIDEAIEAAVELLAEHTRYERLQADLIKA